MGDIYPSGTPVPHRVTADNVEIRDDLHTDLYTVWRALRENPHATPHTLGQRPGRIVTARIDNVVRDLWGTLDEAQVAASAAAVRAHLHQSGHIHPLADNVVWVRDTWTASRTGLHHEEHAGTSSRGVRRPNTVEREPDTTGRPESAGQLEPAEQPGPRGPSRGQPEPARPLPPAVSETAGPASAIDLLRDLVTDHDDARRLRDTLRRRALPLLHDIDRRLGQLLNDLHAATPSSTTPPGNPRYEDHQARRRARDPRGLKE